MRTSIKTKELTTACVDNLEGYFQSSNCPCDLHLDVHFMCEQECWLHNRFLLWLLY